MAQYGLKSRAALNSAEADLIILFNEIVTDFDNTIIYGYRDPILQLELYKKGRQLVGSEWVIVNLGKVVTYKDGITLKSNHNYNPARAVDVAPFPVDFSDIKRLYLFAGYVLGVASRLKKEGKIFHSIRWGGDWDRDTLINDQTFFDLVHFEIIS